MKWRHQVLTAATLAALAVPAALAIALSSTAQADRPPNCGPYTVCNQSYVAGINWGAQGIAGVEHTAGRPPTTDEGLAICRQGLAAGPADRNAFAHGCADIMIKAGVFK